MWFKHRAWIPVAWILSAVNVAAVWFAAQPAEPWHATIHAALGLGFGLGARHLAQRRQAQLPSHDLVEALDQNEQLQQALDDAALRARELEERLDAAEHLLAHRRSEQESPPRAGPA